MEGRFPERLERRVQSLALNLLAGLQSTIIITGKIGLHINGKFGMKLPSLRINGKRHWLCAVDPHAAPAPALGTSGTNLSPLSLLSRTIMT